MPARSPSPPRPIVVPLGAGIVYAILVFAVGFALGALRISLLVPRLGATIAVLAEAPLMLFVSWWVSGRCTTYFRVTASVGARVFMGSVALATLLAAETGVAAVAFDVSPVGYFLSIGSLPGVIGLFAQIAFASFPLVQMALRT